MSGTLSLSRGMVVRQFHLQRGRVMLSSSTDQQMLLGHLLIERGIVAPEQLQSALATRQGSRLRLGTVLMRAGMVSAADLRGVLTEKVRRLLRDALAWTDGEFFFEAGLAPKRSAVAAVVSLADVLKLPAQTQAISVDAHGSVDGANVLVTDDDIIEIIELARPRRRPALRPRRQGAAQTAVGRRRTINAGVDI